jgi:3-oxoadipate enol-lactonase
VAVSLTPVGDGCRIASRLEGIVDGAVLVLSNSLGSTLEMWTPQLAAFTGRFRVLRYDTRGHGGSDVPPGDYSLGRLGRDVLDLLDARQIERAHYCGLSLGGMIGQWLGAHAPERIGRLVLANTSPYMGPAAPWNDRIEVVRRSGMGAITETVLERWFTPRFREREPATVERVRNMLLATSPEGYAGCCAAIRDMDLRNDAARITSPVLLIAGSADPSTPPDITHALARTIPSAPQVVTLDSAHLSNVEQFAAFNQAVLGFLA